MAHNPEVTGSNPVPATKDRRSAAIFDADGVRGWRNFLPSFHQCAATSNIDLLSADVFKVSHHPSKHGGNLELIERIAPRVTLVSSDSTKSRWNFPPTVTQELIREILSSQPRGSPHPVRTTGR
jgi:hypothetical protein